MESDKKIAIVDFGGQYSHLIASRIRRLGAYSEICSNEESSDHLKKYAGIILSGGPSSVYSTGAPTLDPRIFDSGKPILGICYGLQLMVHLLGGQVKKSKQGEYGPAKLILEPSLQSTVLGKGLVSEKIVWMSHGDEVIMVPDGFLVFGYSSNCRHAFIGNPQKNLYGIQYHPEVTHTEQGSILLKNFIELCGVSHSWSLDLFLDQEIQKIQSIANPDKKVFLLVSGGVDSTVAYLVLLKALGPERVKGLLIDTGFMRKEEVRILNEKLRKLGFHLYVKDDSEKFYKALMHVRDPEQKRLIVGNLFLESQEEAAREWNLDSKEWILGQGTIYPDTIESGGTKHSQTIKTHHNRVPAIQSLIQEGRVIEPLKELYKDEVRELGLRLGLEKEFVYRHPFPGPGLVVRMIASNKEIPNGLEKEIQRTLGNNKISIQILPFPSVGVQGDQRTYANCVLLNDFSEDWNELEQIANQITNQFREVNRVVFSPMEKELPKTYFYTELILDKEHADLLREADSIANEVLIQEGIYGSIWQMPVVMVPCGKKQGNYSIVLRPVESQEAMTASFYKMDRKILKKLREQILKIPRIDSVFYDLTHKPPGTIEWE